MTQDISLEELVLGYCRQVDGIIEPPAYGAYEVLLPDDVAVRWGVTPHLRMAFLPEAKNAVYIHFGHSIVEAIVDEIRVKTANGLFFINNVRPEKPKLYEVIEKAISLLNAKMFPIPGELESINLHHYARLNFKISLIADEKRELILPMWMDLQAGFPIKGASIERLAILDPENQYLDTPSASLLWSKDPPLSQKALHDLMERARLLATFELGDTLTSIQKRLKRFLELDRARLNDYYDDLHKDTDRRLQKADDDRRSTLESKLAAIEAERRSKLADVEQKYHLRIQMELVNLAIIAQPKLDLTVEVRKRGVTIKRRVTWDPLLHSVEGMACDVCHRPGLSLMLCENGHLAHSECLAPQCVDCKRTFCQKCAAEVQTCIVCDRPVCIHSLVRCKECGRATCQEHTGACHADAGQPRRVLTETPASQSAASKTGSTDSPKTAGHETGKSPSQKTPAKPKPQKNLAASARVVDKPSSEVVGDFMEVYSDPGQKTILAYVKTKKRDVATREWSMSDEGLAVNCWCEKSDCPERGIVYYPMAADGLTAQLNGLIERFANEYSVPIKKIRFFQVRQGQPFGEIKLKVPADWKDPATLDRAQAGFEALRTRSMNRNRR